MDCDRAATEWSGSSDGSATGGNAGVLPDFTGFAGRTINWGVSHAGKRHSVRLNWNYTERLRDIPVEGAFVPPGTYRYTAPWLQLDVSAEYRVSARFALFMAVRNITNASRIQESYAPDTPWYARLRQEAQFGGTWNVGVKGRF